jgi:tRNA-specific 2-thiouridylase
MKQQNNEQKNKSTVFVGMSGGVDSSVAAALLKKQGYNVIGVYMKNWTQDLGFGCPWLEESQEARRVAMTLNVPFYIWDFEKEYYNQVIKYFFSEYKAGRTPNPDVMCNKEIKFKMFLNKALSFGADYVATGHYAQIKQVISKQEKVIRYKLLKAADPTKEQSYFLYTLTQTELSKTLFPVGHLKKTEVRALAKKFRLPNYNRKDSQGICFIGPVNVQDFLRKNIKSKSGKIVDDKGNVLGQHDGLAFYTIGQREGIKVGGQGPYYVIDKNFSNNQLVVTNNPDHKKLWRKKMLLEQVTWTVKQPKFPFRAKIAIRYHHPESLCKISRLGNNLLIIFDKPQRAITLGQSAVIYKSTELLGGGVISKVY